MKSTTRFPPPTCPGCHKPLHELKIGYWEQNLAFDDETKKYVLDPRAATEYICARCGAIVGAEHPGGITGFIPEVKE